MRVTSLLAILTLFSCSAVAVRGEDHWSFKPVQRPALPVFDNQAQIVNPIDSFVRTKLVVAGIAPAPPADRITLIRRVTIDLVGLPPTPDEIDDFLHDDRPDAYSRLVERLLASPHYG